MLSSLLIGQQSWSREVPVTDGDLWSVRGGLTDAIGNGTCTLAFFCDQDS